MVTSDIQDTSVPTNKLLANCGVLDFLSAWRSAFQAGTLLISALGMMACVVWIWILDRLWMIGGAAGTPSNILRGHSCSFDSFLSIGALLWTHWFYALCLLVPLLFLWSLIGGAIWRQAAVIRTGEAAPRIGRSLEFASQHFWHGFFLTWALPLAFGVLVSAFLVIYGMFKAIPWVGDVIGGAFYFVPLVFGLLLAFGVLVLGIAGHLFGPGVAVAGDHGADAVTHGVSFVLNKPLRAVLYLLTTCLMTWITSIVLAWLVAGAEVLTERLLSFGELTWSTRGDAASDRTSDFLTGCWMRVLECVGMGAVVSVFFAGSTVSFLLMREVVDGTPRPDAAHLGSTSNAAAEADKTEGETNAHA